MASILQSFLDWLRSLFFKVNEDSASTLCVLSITFCGVCCMEYISLRAAFG